MLDSSRSKVKQAKQDQPSKQVKAKFSRSPPFRFRCEGRGRVVPRKRRQWCHNRASVASGTIEARWCRWCGCASVARSGAAVKAARRKFRHTTIFAAWCSLSGATCGKQDQGEGDEAGDGVTVNGSCKHGTKSSRLRSVFESHSDYIVQVWSILRHSMEVPIGSVAACVRLHRKRCQAGWRCRASKGRHHPRYSRLRAVGQRLQSVRV